MSENRSITLRSRFTFWRYGNCGRNQRLLSTSSLWSSISYDWRVNGVTTALPFYRQTKKRTETDIRTNRRTSRHTDRRAFGQTRQDGQDRSRDKTQKTTDENQETRRETRTVSGAVWCTLRRVGGWLLGGRAVLLCVAGGVVGGVVWCCVVWCCVVFRVVCLCLFSSLEVAVCSTGQDGARFNVYLHDKLN